MTQELLVFISGLVLFLVPFLGIPTVWKLYIVSGIGLLLILIGYRLRYRRAIREMERSEQAQADSFVEATPPLFTRSGSTE